MKLEVWQRAIDLYKLVSETRANVKTDFKIRGQILDAAQSVSANIAEGYSRRSINEYIQHLYIALGSLSETLTRLLAMREACQISGSSFEAIDVLHYEVENKLLNLVRSLETKRDVGGWIDRVGEQDQEYTV